MAVQEGNYFETWAHMQLRRQSHSVTCIVKAVGKQDGGTVRRDTGLRRCK